ncbi:MAG: DUF3822 family protein [Bacteroidales bacterium]|nr:DUF3822 family protein [Bacteroidales bacterium]
MSRHTSKVALVPSAFFDPASVREMLSRTVILDQEDKVEYISLPELSAELVYSLSPQIPDPDGADEPVIRKPTLSLSKGEAKDLLPELYHVLKSLSSVTEHNKIVASYGDGVLSLAIAQGDKLLLANTFQAADFTTAEYFLFMAVKRLQLNPEVSSIHFRTALSAEEEMSLYRYFKSVEVL